MGSYILYILTWSSEGIWETSILIYMANEDMSVGTKSPREKVQYERSEIGLNQGK